MKASKILYFSTAVIIVCAIVAICRLKRTEEYGAKRRTVFLALPLTGELANIGKIAKKTAEFYQINHPESCLQICFVDVQSSPSRALTAISQATLNADAPCVICMFSIFSKVIVPYIAQKGGFTLPISTIDMDELHQIHAFQRISNSVEDVMKPLIEYANNNKKTMFVIYVDDDFGEANKNYFCERYSGKIFGAVSFKATENNAREVALTAIRTNPSAILLTGTPSSAYLNVFRGLKEYGYDGTILSDISFTNPFVYKTLGVDAEGTICVANSCMLADSDNSPDFVKDNIPAYFLTVQMYDALALLEVIVANNKDLSQKTFEELGFFEGCTDRITFQPGGNSLYSFILSKITSAGFVRQLLEEDR